MNTRGGCQMGYQQYGISPQLVQRVKLKMKNQIIREKIKNHVHGLTKADLKNRVKVQQIVKSCAIMINESLTEQQHEQIVRFVLDQGIDPKNTFHLIKLWGMFR